MHATATAAAATPAFNLPPKYANKHAKQLHVTPQSLQSLGWANIHQFRIDLSSTLPPDKLANRHSICRKL